MYELIIENEKGQQLRLTNNEGRYVIDKIEGLTPPTAEISIYDNIGDGAEFKYERTGKRNIVINMYITGDVEENRIALYNYVKNGKYIKLYFKNGRRNVWIAGYVETLEIDNFTMNTTCQISVLCPDPWWKDVLETINNIDTVKGNFYFPFYRVEPEPFSTYEKIQILNLTNKGDVSSGMTIELTATGEVVNPIIYNRETSEYIGIGDETHRFMLLPNQRLVITTHPGNKKIVIVDESFEINVFNYLREGSKFLQVEPGDNVFTYGAESGNEFVQIQFKYYSEYEGV